MVNKVIACFNQHKSPVVYTSGALVNAFSQVLANVIIYSIIPPEDVGIWTTWILFQTYAMFLQAGVINGLNRELPFELGKGNNKEALNYASTAQAFTVYSIFITLVAGLLLVVLNKGNNTVKLTLMAVVLITGLKFYENYLTSTFRSAHAFYKLGLLNILRGGIGLISVLLVLWLGYPGFVIRFILISTVFTIFLFIIKPISASLSFHKKSLILLLKTGLPIFILSYLFSSAQTFDRVWLIKYDNTATIGLYSFGLMLASSIQNLPVAIASYIYPRMSFSIGQNKKSGDIWNLAFKSNAIILLMLTPVCFLLFLFLPALVSKFFPQYIGGIISARILLVSAWFFSGTVGSNILWSYKAWSRIAILQISGCFLYLLLPLLGIKILNSNMTGVAVGVLIASVIYFFMSNIISYFFIKQSCKWE